MPIERTMNAAIVVAYSCVFFVVLQNYQITALHGYEPEQNISGCAHNGSIFANGSFVPTVEPCLNCKCINANLICALRVCPEQPIPPPRGCIVVQKRDTCCPYLTCSKYHADYTPDDKNRKVITYDRKWYEQNIRNRIFSQNTLLRRIDDGTPPDGDPARQELSNNQQMCVHNGTVYRSGSAMSTSSLCSYCYCIGGKQKCVKPKCLLPTDGCEPILIDTSCCPIRYDCSGNGTIKAQYRPKSHRRRSENLHYLRMTSRMQRSRGCLVNSSFYPEGHKLPANQTNPCEICFCIGGSKRCTPKKCAPVIRNCRPIIPDGQCCPASYDCDHKPVIPMARGFTARQYDFFSLLFGDEDKENATASWDEESETEAVDGKLKPTSEKSFLDAIRDGLNLIEAGNNNDSTAPAPPLTSFPTAAAAQADESEADDEEEISIIDFLLNGEKIFSSTTASPLNTVTMSSGNGGAAYTNSPMHIKPILPDEAKNGTMKFALLPMSLYNMVKEDGSIVFEANNGTHILARTPIVGINAEEVETTTDATTEEMQTTIATMDGDESRTTSGSAETTNTATEPSTARAETDSPSTIETTSVETTSAASIESREDDVVNRTAISSATESSITSTAARKEKEKIVTTTTTAVPKPNTATEQTTSGITANETAPKFATTTIELEASASTLIASTESSNHLTTMRQPVVIDLNPSILETDLNYDYSEPTLPPSLPNLKIIPFLPTDAVKPVDAAFSRQKVTYINTNTNSNKNKNHNNNNYYLSHSNPYSGGAPAPIHSNQNYSPFNVKPATDKYPVYNGQPQLAGDRLDYDGYNKPDSDNLPNIDYSNVYSISGIDSSNANNVVSAGVPFVHGSVDSKLEFDAFNQKVKPPPKNTVATTTVRNLLTVNRFETPYSDLFHVPRPRPTTNTRPTDNFHYNNPIPSTYGDDTYLAQYQRQPDFDEDYTLLNEPPNKHAIGDGSVAPPSPVQFSYSGKNNFMPPLQTEGGFVPKKPIKENYIPLHGNGFHKDAIEPKANQTQLAFENMNQSNGTELTMSIDSILNSLNVSNNDLTQLPNANQTMMDFEKYIISITTDASYQAMPEYSDAFLAVDVSEKAHPNVNANKSNSNDTISAPNKQSAFVLNEPFNQPPLGESDSDEGTDSAEEPAGVDFFSNLYGFIFKDDEPIRSTSTKAKTAASTTTVQFTSTSTSTPSMPPKIVKRKNETHVTPPTLSRNDTIPLKLITILNHAKKESLPKVEIKQRKNNKIIDPTDEPLLEDTQLPSTTPNPTSISNKVDNLTVLRDVLLATLNSSRSADAEHQHLPKTPIFLPRPINNISPTFIGNGDFAPVLSSVNSIDSKHSFQPNPIRSELDLIIPELNRNQQNDFNHKNFGADGYQVLPNVELDKLNGATAMEHRTHGETKIFTPPSKDMAGLLKLAGCNIYGRMYRVGRIIDELSGPCLECRCTEVGVSCTPLNC